MNSKVSEKQSVLLLGSLAASLINFRKDLIRVLLEQGYRVLAAAPGMDATTAAKLVALGAEPKDVPVVRTGMNPLADVKSLIWLAGFMRREKPCAVISYTAKPVIYGTMAAVLAGVPRRIAMITGLGYAFTEGKEPKRKIAQRVASALYKVALPFAHSVIFQNPDDRDLFIERRLLKHRDRASIVNGSGVDLSHFAERPLPHGMTFLMIARLLRDKGVREYAEAARVLRTTHSDAQVCLAGWIDQSPDAISDQELAAWQTEGLQYIGRLEDVREAIAKANVIVLPSYREGTPRTVLEGMAMGRAIITTDAPGCREPVKEGVNGLLVPVRDAKALAAAMAKLAGDPELVARMGLASRRMAREKYDAGTVARSVIRLAGLERAA